MAISSQRRIILTPEVLSDVRCVQKTKFGDLKIAKLCTIESLYWTFTLHTYSGSLLEGAYLKHKVASARLFGVQVLSV